MKTFSMSQYVSKEGLFEARSVYYESLTYTLIDRLIELEELRLDMEEGNYYWVSSGDRL